MKKPTFTEYPLDVGIVVDFTSGPPDDYDMTWEEAMEVAGVSDTDYMVAGVLDRPFKHHPAGSVVFEKDTTCLIEDPEPVQITSDMFRAVHDKDGEELVPIMMLVVAMRDDGRKILVRTQALSAEDTANRLDIEIEASHDEVSGSLSISRFLDHRDGEVTQKGVTDTQPTGGAEDRTLSQTVESVRQNLDGVIAGAIVAYSNVLMAGAQES